MSKITNNIGQICTKEEFERFKSFHELFTKYMKEGDLPSEKFEQLFEDINDFETTIVPIAKKVGIDLSKHVDTVGEMWEQLELTHPKVTCAGWTGERVEEAIESVYYEYEAKLQERREAIADLDKVMVTLYASQPKDTEAIEYMTAVFEDLLERKKEDLAGRQRNKRGISSLILTKTSRLILTVIVTIFAAVIAAIVVDILADFGWLQSIKEFIYNGFWSK